MPILGNLSEFSLPEVLLMISSRTGRLRLYDVPEYIVAEIDLAEGQTHGLHLLGRCVTDPQEIISTLSNIVESSQGMFEFRSQPVTLVNQNTPMPISHLAMLLVLHVDKKLAEQHTVVAPELFYTLESPETQIRIDPDLEMFFQHSRDLLDKGVWAAQLAEYLGLKPEVARLNLSYLRQLGFVRALNDIQSEPIEKMTPRPDPVTQTNSFQVVNPVLGFKVA